MDDKESSKNPIKKVEQKTCIVSANDEMRAVDADLLEEFRKDCNGKKSIVTTIETIIAEGYNSESGIHVLRGTDGKFYVVHSYAGQKCGHDNKVIDILDNFEKIADDQNDS